jgi:hypothetical protein
MLKAKKIVAILLFLIRYFFIFVAISLCQPKFLLAGGWRMMNWRVRMKGLKLLKTTSLRNNTKKL